MVGNNEVLIANILLFFTTLAGFVYQIWKLKSESNATRQALRERDEALLAREKQQHDWDVEDRERIAANVKEVLDKTAADLAEKTKREVNRLQVGIQETKEGIKENTALTEQVAVDTKAVRDEVRLANGVGPTIEKVERVTEDTNVRVKQMETNGKTQE